MLEFHSPVCADQYALSLAWTTSKVLNSTVSLLHQTLAGLTFQQRVFTFL